MHRQQWAQQLIRRYRLERRVLPTCVGLLMGLPSIGLPLALRAEPCSSDTQSTNLNAQSALRLGQRFEDDFLWIHAAFKLDRDTVGLEASPNDHRVTTGQPVPSERAMLATSSPVSPPESELLSSVDQA